MLNTGFVFETGFKTTVNNRGRLGFLRACGMG
mgnify:CR=1 FL=1